MTYYRKWKNNMNNKSIAILDETLKYACRFGRDVYFKVNKFRIDLHLKRRFKERYGMDYTKELDEHITQEISNMKTYKTSTYGSRVYVLRLGNKFIFPVTINCKGKKLRSFLTEEMYRKVK